VVSLLGHVSTGTTIPAFAGYGQFDGWQTRAVSCAPRGPSSTPS